jgi:hypothetical protein
VPVARQHAHRERRVAPGASGAAACYAFAILDSPLTLVGVAAPGRRDRVTIVSNPDELRRIDGAKRCLGRVVRMLVSFGKSRSHSCDGRQSHNNER